MSDTKKTWARSLGEAALVDITRILLALAWRTLPLRHPAWRGIYLAGQAIRHPAEAEAHPPDHIYSNARFDELLRDTRADERERCATLADSMDCAHRCAVGWEVGKAIRSCGESTPSEGNAK